MKTNKTLKNIVKFKKEEEEDLPHWKICFQPIQNIIRLIWVRVYSFILIWYYFWIISKSSSSAHPKYEGL